MCVCVCGVCLCVQVCVSTVLPRPCLFINHLMFIHTGLCKQVSRLIHTHTHTSHAFKIIEDFLTTCGVTTDVCAVFLQYGAEVSNLY